MRLSESANALYSTATLQNYASRKVKLGLASDRGVDWWSALVGCAFAFAFACVRTATQAHAHTACSAIWMVGYGRTGVCTWLHDSLRVRRFLRVSYFKGKVGVVLSIELRSITCATYFLSLTGDVFAAI